MYETTIPLKRLARDNLCLQYYLQLSPKGSHSTSVLEKGTQDVAQMPDELVDMKSS
ncbi:hypothetical protein P691DRAFT_768901 [Macrolepiota fuliginosa MF-IS2]|uniref:Uncharacterized protein n=1 Tax=Macrolepiota fuliginosa MF-IS2 TaxID=1400762 RepID=A0A9P6BUE3_9AGAR|nr:hypothetical protein P691DRAFT_768901 [Macrolepiota fuliginosa MF-IS2]